MEHPKSEKQDPSSLFSVRPKSKKQDGIQFSVAIGVAHGGDSDIIDSQSTTVVGVMCGDWGLNLCCRIEIFIGRLDQNPELNVGLFRDK